jgi:DNA-binding transcriptional MerR regulator
MTKMNQDSLFPWENDPQPPAEPTAPAPAPARAPARGTPTAGNDPASPEPKQPAPRKQQTAETETSADPASTKRGERQLVKKEYYSISEVADLVGLPAHVLRYWETQFSVLNPSKNRSGNRVYQRKEIRLIMLVKQLLYDEKYTVEGAKQKLEQLRRGGTLPESTVRALDTQLVRVLRDDLKQVLRILSPDSP